MGNILVMRRRNITAHTRSTYQQVPTPTHTQCWGNNTTQHNVWATQHNVGATQGGALYRISHVFQTIYTHCALDLHSWVPCLVSCMLHVVRNIRTASTQPSTHTPFISKIVHNSPKTQLYSNNECYFNVQIINMISSKSMYNCVS